MNAEKKILFAWYKMYIRIQSLLSASALETIDFHSDFLVLLNRSGSIYDFIVGLYVHHFIDCCWETATANYTTNATSFPLDAVRYLLKCTIINEPDRPAYFSSAPHTA